MAEKKELTREEKKIQDLTAENDMLLKRCELAEQRVTSLVNFAKATHETNEDLLSQIDGATKSNRKLHNLGGQNLNQLLQVLEQEKKNN